MVKREPALPFPQTLVSFPTTTHTHTHILPLDTHTHLPIQRKTYVPPSFHGAPQMGSLQKASLRTVATSLVKHGRRMDR